MNIKNRVLLSYFFLTILLHTSYVVAIDDNTSIYLYPDIYNASSVDEQVELDIMIQNVENLHSWSLELNYDMEVLQFIEALEGDFLNQTGETIFIIKEENAEPGCTTCNSKIILSDILLPREGSSGSGWMATVRFKILKEAIKSKVELRNTLLLGSIIEGSVYPNIEHESESAHVSLTLESGVVAFAGDDVNVVEDRTIVFDGSGSQGQDLEYTWTFDDNGTKELTGETVEYSFTSPGTYEVTLLVSDGVHFSNDRFLVYVKDITPPVVVFKLEGVNDNNEVDIGRTLTFNGSGSYDPEGGIAWKFLWDFGDGTNSSERVTTHKYESSGEYIASLTVFDGHNNHITQNKKIIVKEFFDLRLLLIIPVVVIPLIFYIRKRQ